MQSPEDIGNAARQLADTSRTLFETGDRTVTPPGSSRTVTIKTATVRTLGALVGLMEATAKQIDPALLSSIVQAFADKQQEAIASGKDPLDVEKVLPEVVQSALGGHTMIFTLFNAANEALPEVIHMFTDLTKEEFLDMELDHAVVVAGCVFLANYDFFTQRLLPILVGLLQSSASKHRKLTTPANAQGSAQNATAPANRAMEIQKTGK